LTLICRDPAFVIPLPKKNDSSDCNSWRDITLLSVPGSVCKYSAEQTERWCGDAPANRTSGIQARKIMQRSDIRAQADH